MTDLRKAAEMALDALDAWLVADVTKLPIVIPQTENTVFALRQALAQSEQEKLCKYCFGIGRVVCDGRCMPE